MTQKIVQEGNILTKLEWERSGSQIAVGTTNGDLQLYHLGDVLSLFTKLSHLKDAAFHTRRSCQIPQIRLRLGARITTSPSCLV